MDPRTRDRLLYEFSGPPYDSALTRDELLHELFEATADRIPDKVALVSGQTSLSYAQLEERGNRLANYLRAQGLGPEDMVAIMAPKTEFVYLAMLGVLKAGAAYVPLDPGYPSDRVAFILTDCKAKLLITCSEILEKLGEEVRNLNLPLLLTDKDTPRIEQAAATRLTRQDTGLRKENLCYVIYTSGTTGRPKGCLIEHRNICSLVRSESVVYGFTEEDRVFQAASVAFDASLEEIWMAFFHGATLVAGTKELMQSGLELAGHLSRLRITALSCVPTLLSMIDGDVETLRILILGGEACPKDLAARWCKPTRVIFNSYGPTEATVVATCGVLKPNAPVTIGRAIPNYRVYVLDERMELVAPGAEGELYIGGPGVARGYLNREDLNREKFPVTDKLTGETMRLYRTGDLVRFTPEGELEYLGRADDQVKLRGYRVELSEIESVLMQQCEIQSAAVALHKETQQLAAYVVLRRGRSLNRGSLRETLIKRLPVFMVPAFLDELEALPMLTSGKVNRKALPAPAAPFLDETRECVAPRSETEQELAQVWAEVFGRASVSVTDDFFLDLGGHSLLAATTVSRLRETAEFGAISVGDIYQHPTIERLAQYFEAQAQAALARAQDQSTKPAEPSEPFLQPNPGAYLLCGLAQAAGVLILAGIYAWQWLGPFFTFSYLTMEDWATHRAVAAALLVYAVTFPVLLILLVAVKWLLLGRVQAGSHPLWGGFYLRFWFVRQLSRAVPIKFLAGTPLIGIFYRLMGARVGKDVFLGSVGVMSYDLLDIGDGASLGYDSSIDGTWVENGRLFIAPIAIGKNCAIGNRSILGGHTRLKDGASLGDLSLLPESGVIPAGEYWEGSPAAFVRANAPAAPERVWSFGYGLLFALGVFLFPILVEGAIFPGLALITKLDYYDPTYKWLIWSPFIGISFIVLICAEVAATKWLLLPRIKEGRFSLRSAFYYRKWFLGQMLHVSLEVLGTLYSTLYLKPFFRLLKARIGHRSEISTVCYLEPELMVAGDECFLADDVMIGAPEVRNGHMSIGYAHVGDRTFVGNSAVVPGGVVLAGNALIGCLSVPPCQNPIPEGTSWFGSPSLLLPKRQQAEHFSEAQTYLPSKRLVALRYTIEFFRVCLPSILFVILATMVMNLIDQLPDEAPLWISAALLPPLYLAAGVVSVLLTVALKWLLAGRYRIGSHPLWCSFIWRTELVTGVYENFAALFILDILRGTPFMAWPLRLMGMKIGKRTYLDSTWFTEFDLIEIGDDTALNEDANLQTHLFEDRVMKVGPVRLGARCTVGMKATILYNTQLRDGVSLGDLSLIMKGETLPAETRWQGAPARRLN
jgi:non-ribosomal peptide synthetase-like protein